MTTYLDVKNPGDQVAFSEIQNDFGESDPTSGLLEYYGAASTLPGIGDEIAFSDFIGAINLRMDMAITQANADLQLEAAYDGVEGVDYLPEIVTFLTGTSYFNYVDTNTTDTQQESEGYRKLTRLEGGVTKTYYAVGDGDDARIARQTKTEVNVTETLNTTPNSPGYGVWHGWTRTDPAEYIDGNKRLWRKGTAQRAEVYVSDSDDPNSPYGPRTYLGSFTYTAPVTTNEILQASNYLKYGYEDEEYTLLGARLYTNGNDQGWRRVNSNGSFASNYIQSRVKNNDQTYIVSADNPSVASAFGFSKQYIYTQNGWVERTAYGYPVWRENGSTTDYYEVNGEICSRSQANDTITVESETYNINEFVNSTYIENEEYVFRYNEYYQKWFWGEKYPLTQSADIRLYDPYYLHDPIVLVNEFNSNFVRYTWWTPNVFAYNSSLPYGGSKNPRDQVVRKTHQPLEFAYGSSVDTVKTPYSFDYNRANSLNKNVELGTGYAGTLGHLIFQVWRTHPSFTLYQNANGTLLGEVAELGNFDRFYICGKSDTGWQDWMSQDDFNLPEEYGTTYSLFAFSKAGASTILDNSAHSTLWKYSWYGDTYDYVTNNGRSSGTLPPDQEEAPVAVQRNGTAKTYHRVRIMPSTGVGRELYNYAGRHPTITSTTGPFRYWNDVPSYRGFYFYIDAREGGVDQRYNYDAPNPDFSKRTHLWVQSPDNDDYLGQSPSKTTMDREFKIVKTVKSAGLVTYTPLKRGFTYSNISVSQTTPGYYTYNYSTSTRKKPIYSYTNVANEERPDIIEIKPTPAYTYDDAKKWKYRKSLLNQTPYETKDSWPVSVAFSNAWRPTEEGELISLYFLEAMEIRLDPVSNQNLVQFKAFKSLTTTGSPSDLGGYNTPARLEFTIGAGDPSELGYDKFFKLWRKQQNGNVLLSYISPQVNKPSFSATISGDNTNFSITGLDAAQTYRLRWTSYQSSLFKAGLVGPNQGSVSEDFSSTTVPTLQLTGGDDMSYSSFRQGVDLFLEAQISADPEVWAVVRCFEYFRNGNTKTVEANTDFLDGIGT